MNPSLDELAIHHGTDKATKHPLIAPHCYTPYYEFFFHPLRFQAIKFLEIGVGGGESIKTWLDYFPSARVFGLDKVCDTNPWNTRGTTIDERYTFIQGDQTDATMWKCLLADYGGNWDVVIDDGGHFNDEVVMSFNGMWPAVKPGGLYCIEDIGVDCPGSIFRKAGHPGHLEFLTEHIQNMNSGKGEVEAIHFMRELAIIRKKEACTPK